MGWTYSACVIERGSIDFDKHKDDTFSDHLITEIGDKGECIIDDCTFDRERLGLWMGLTSEQMNSIHSNGYCVVSLEQLKVALDFLEDLVSKVKKMPFDKGSENRNVCVGFDKNKGESVYKWTGTSKNKEIYDIVMKSFAKDYHFNFPWDHNPNDVGVPDYIDSLKNAIGIVEDIITCPDNDGKEIDIILLSH